jgi:hypothetical protein
MKISACRLYIWRGWRGKASHTKLHEDQARKLVDTRFADRGRCRNQTYLDNSDMTPTKNHKRKKNSM